MRTHPGITITSHVGAGILPVVDELAHLRIAVFRDWPYLYDGDAAYERRYLAAYAQSAASVCVVARNDQGETVGASTGLPLADDDDAFQRTFREHGLPVDQVFYFGESVLLAPWRGRGVGHAFFDAREAHVASLGRFRWTAFCSVRRAADDPRASEGHRTNDAFWRGRGYAPAAGMTCTLSWKERGADAPTPHVLDFWLRDWQAPHA